MPFSSIAFVLTGILLVFAGTSAHAAGHLFEEPSKGGRSEAPAKDQKKLSNAEVMATIFNRNECNSCHGPRPDGKHRELFNEKGDVLNKADIPLILDAFKEEGISESMKRKIRRAIKGMSEDEKTAVKAWAAENNRKDYNLNPAPKNVAIPESTAQALKDGFFKSLYDPKVLAKRITDKKGPAPRILNIGPKGDILGATNIGQLSDAGAQARLNAYEKSLPNKNEEVIIYCGCCELETCPNVLRALAVLRDRGYTNVHVLNLPENIETDWEAHNYPLAPVAPQRR